MREAACACGQLRVRAEGEPIRVSVCHCLACQRRTGSAFGVQARFSAEQLEHHGEASVWERVGDEGGVMTARFCPRCGSTVWWTLTGMEGVAVAVGAFADPEFPGPTRSIYEDRAHRWVELRGILERWA